MNRDLNKKKQDKYAYRNAKKFVKELYFKDNFEILDKNTIPFIGEIIENLRGDIRKFNILEELEIPETNFYQKLDRLESNLLKKTQI